MIDEPKKFVPETQAMSGELLTSMVKDLTDFFAEKKWPKAHTAILMQFVLTKLRQEGIDVAAIAVKKPEPLVKLM